MYTYTQVMDSMDQKVNAALQQIDVAIQKKDVMALSTFAVSKTGLNLPEVPGLCNNYFLSRINRELTRRVDGGKLKGYVIMSESSTGIVLRITLK